MQLANPAASLTLLDAMKPRFLLDTSAVRSISGRTLEALAPTCTLEMPSYAAWELLTHLDDPGKFARAKGQVMKCRHLSVLEDLRAAFDMDLDIPNPALKGKQPDTGLVRLMIEMLDHSSSLEEFYKLEFRDREDVQRGVDDLAASIRRVLAEEEANCKTFFHGIADHLRAHPITEGDDARAAEAVIAVWDGFIIPAEQAAGGRDLTEEVFDRRYYASAYAIARGNLMKRTNRAFDKNDARDLKMVMHLHLSDNVTFVTGDGGLKEAVDLGTAWLKSAPSYAPRRASSVRTTTAQELAALAGTP